MGKLIVKTNKLNSAIQNLTLAELHIIQLGIINARETGNGLNPNEFLRIEALSYSKAFNTSPQNAYKRLKEAEDTLFNRRFSYIDNNGKLVKSRWISEVRYDDGAIEIIFTPSVIEGISRIDGAENFFTSYLLEQTASMKSSYSVRLYELLIQWKNAKKTPIFQLERFRGQLGLGVDEYQRMGNFKLRVLDLAVKEINEKSDITVKYEQVKKGRKIEGFKFTIEQKNNTVENEKDRDKDTVDWVSGMTDKQIQLFASKLANDDIFSTRTFVAPIGADMNSYILSIQQNLSSPMFQQMWAEDLKRLGFDS